MTPCCVRTSCRAVFSISLCKGSCCSFSGNRCIAKTPSSKWLHGAPYATLPDSLTPGGLCGRENFSHCQGCSFSCRISLEHSEFCGPSVARCQDLCSQDRSYGNCRCLPPCAEGRDAVTCVACLAVVERPTGFGLVESPPACPVAFLAS